MAAPGHRVCPNRLIMGVEGEVELELNLAHNWHTGQPKTPGKVQFSTDSQSVVHADERLIRNHKSAWPAKNGSLGL